MTIPLARPDVGEAEIRAVTEVLQTPVLSLGPKLMEFEQAFCSYTGADYATAVSSGTAALHLAVRALGIGPGDEVITTPFSFVASANCILFEGARPVFVDVDPETFNLDLDRIPEAVTPRTAAILPVHVFGRPVAMDRLLQIAREWQLRVIEDACEAAGARLGGQHVGTFGDVGVFAFYPNKQMTTGEGGMLVTDHAHLDEIFKSLRNQGRSAGEGWLKHDRVGYNYRLSEINCALGIEQLRRLPEFLSRRHEVAALYSELLGEMEEIRLPISAMQGAQISWFVYVIQLRDADRRQRDELIRYLQKNGVASSDYFSPIHLQPYFREMGYRPGDFPVAESIGASTVALPFFTQITEEQVRKVVKTLRNGIYELGMLRRGSVAHTVRGSVL